MNWRIKLHCMRPSVHATDKLGFLLFILCAVWLGKWNCDWQTKYWIDAFRLAKWKEMRLKLSPCAIDSNHLSSEVLEFCIQCPGFSSDAVMSSEHQQDFDSNCTTRSAPTELIQKNIMQSPKALHHLHNSRHFLIQTTTHSVRFLYNRKENYSKISVPKF